MGKGERPNALNQRETSVYNFPSGYQFIKLMELKNSFRLKLARNEDVDWIWNLGIADRFGKSLFGDWSPSLFPYFFKTE